MQISQGLRLGRIAGIEIRLDWSLGIIFFLILYSLAVYLFPAWHPDWSASTSWITGFAAAVLFFASVLTHEMSHALVGRRFGMEIRRITLFIFGGMAHLEDEPPTWKAELSMAAVGPITSLIIGVVFLWIGGIIAGPVDMTVGATAALASLGPVATLLMWLGPINILLGLFNLVPGFPLDGGRVLRAILWAITGNLRKATLWASRGGQAFAWLLIGSGVAMMLGIPVPPFGAGLVNGLWLAFIGWFLHNAAIMSYRQLLVRESLVSVPVERLMLRRFESVGPDMNIDTLIDEYLMASGQRAFPVKERGDLVGMISMQDLRKRGKEQWRNTSVRDVMTPASELAALSPDTDAYQALEVLGQRDLNQLPVIHGGELIGLIRREDIMKWLALTGREV